MYFSFSVCVKWDSTLTYNTDLHQGGTGGESQPREGSRHLLTHLKGFVGLTWYMYPAYSTIPWLWVKTDIHRHTTAQVAVDNAPGSFPLTGLSALGRTRLPETQQESCSAWEPPCASTTATS